MRRVNHGSPPCLSPLHFSWVSSGHQYPPFSPAVGHCSAGGFPSLLKPPLGHFLLQVTVTHAAVSQLDHWELAMRLVLPVSLPLPDGDPWLECLTLPSAARLGLLQPSGPSSPSANVTPSKKFGDPVPSCLSHSPFSPSAEDNF